jgi:hypothetical protein
MIDIGKAQAEKPPIDLLAVFLDIRFRPFALLDHCTDRGRDGDEQEQKHGQLDRGEEFDQFAGKFLPSQARGRRSGSILGSQSFGLTIHRIANSFSIRHTIFTGPRDTVDLGKRRSCAGRQSQSVDPVAEQGGESLKAGILQVSEKSCQAK